MNIQKPELIRTYYTGQEIPIPDKKVSITAEQRKSFYRKLGALALSLLVLTAAAVTVKYFFGGRPEPINITKTEAASSPIYDNNISYYDYGRLKNMHGPIVLEHRHNCAAINLGKASNLSEGVISFASKGECGKERVAVILRDANRMSNANQDDVILTPTLDNDRWQPFDIRLKQLYLPLDISRVTQVRFKISFEHDREQYPEARVYIKDIAIK